MNDHKIKFFKVRRHIRIVPDRMKYHNKLWKIVRFTENKDWFIINRFTMHVDKEDRLWKVTFPVYHPNATSEHERDPSYGPPEEISEYCINPLLKGERLTQAVENQLIEDMKTYNCDNAYWTILPNTFLEVEEFNKDIIEAPTPVTEEPIQGYQLTASDYFLIELYEGCKELFNDLTYLMKRIVRWDKIIERIF